ncbi:MAG: methyltransferase [Proteobacteria bacterium]|nr:methyltransferase [Pseudomonadota bacterium]
MLREDAGRLISKNAKTEISHSGVRVFNARHRSIRQLKRSHTPAIFGYRVWKSSWLLIDYIRQEGLSDGLRIMDVGCGWGLAGIYCAKQHQARVTCVDADDGVFPFLRFHSDLNQVEIETRHLNFGQLTDEHFTGIDMMIGADICFWNDLVDPVISMIRRAQASGVRLILIADPGRTPFEEVGRRYDDENPGLILNRRISRPYQFEGRILKIGSLTGFRPDLHAPSPRHSG